MVKKLVIAWFAFVAASASFIAGASAAPVGYEFDGLAFYQFGAPADVATGTPTGGPDTGFIRITNNGASTFTGTIGYNAIAGSGTPSTYTISVTLNAGDHISISPNSESSNQGGYNGPTGTIQNGAQYEMKGTVSLGGNSELVDLTIFDKDIHSGAPRTNPFGVVLDNYIIQGGDNMGRDTGDDFETTQTPGPFSFVERVGGTVPEPATLLLLSGGVGAIAAFRRFRAG
jgi:PEP-CTERM motif-containing protein